MAGKNYTDDFKLHIVELYHNGRSIAELSKEYKIHNQTIGKWIQFQANSGSFKHRDNLSGLEKELEEQKQKNIQQQMEIDILKKAMAIMLKS